MRLDLVLTACIAAAIASVAHADPCKAIPDHGPAPAYLSPGATFSGQVVYVGDGDSLCVAVGSGPRNWVEVRLADFYAPELHDPGGEQARATLSRLTYGRQAMCVADHQSHDRMVSTCRIKGRSIGDMLRAAGVHEGGDAYPAADIALSEATPSRSAPSGEPYSSCAAARAAGAAPMYQGDPGYNPRLDGDHDGIACEPYSRR